MSKYRHISQNSDCVPYQMIPQNTLKAETKVLEKYTINCAGANGIFMPRSIPVQSTECKLTGVLKHI